MKSSGVGLAIVLGLVSGCGGTVDSANNGTPASAGAGGSSGEGGGIGASGSQSVAGSTGAGGAAGQAQSGVGGAPLGTAGNPSSAGGVSGDAGGAPAGLGGAAGSAPSTAGAPASGGVSAAGGSSSSAGGMTMTGGAPNTGGTPGAGGMPISGTGFNVQAMNAIFLGDIGWDGTASPDASDWQDFGLNVDGLHFTSTSPVSTHCKLAQGGDPQDEIYDGVGGLDNSFGKNIIPILQAFVSSPSQTVSQTIQNGVFSMMIQIADLGAGTDYPELSAQLFSGRGSDFSGNATGPAVPPTFSQMGDGSYVWHPFPDALVDPTVEDPTLYQSHAQFPHSAMVGNVWSSGTKSDLPLTLIVGGISLPLSAHQALIQLTYSADHKTGAMGNIGGVLRTVELDDAFKKAAAGISTSFCSGPTVDNIIEQITATSDINADGTQHPDQVCDGVSIGLGFETNLAQLGDPAPVVTPVDPCAGSGG